MNNPPIYGGDDYDRIGFCDVCGEPVYRGDKHYRLPDGKLLCDDFDCRDEWLEEYESVN